MNIIVKIILARATDPFLAEKDRSKFVDELCERINKDYDGASIATRLLAHKLLSPDQSEALCALKTIDRCVRRCGQRFHAEIAKFRFLNQFVRLLSPKYNGESTSEEVKKLAIEMLFIWQKSMRYFTKFKEVYDMLKDQNVILNDPEPQIEAINVEIPPRLATFEDEEKSLLLSQLLKSNKKDDLYAANQLIKSMVRSENQKLERIHRRNDILEKVKNNCRILDDILACSNINERSKKDLELASELSSYLANIRPTLYHYIGEATETDYDALADILFVNDTINKTLQNYKSFTNNLASHGNITDELIIVENSCMQNRDDAAVGHLLTPRKNDNSAANDEEPLISMETKLSLDLNELSLLMDQASFIESNTTVRDRLENVNENVNSNHQCEESIRMTVESSVDPFNSSSSEINSNIV